jgi:AsmA protein
MGRIVVIFAWIVGALLLAAGAGLAYALSLVSPTNVRAEVEKAVEAATGRDLTIAGEVGVALWPVFGVSAKDVSLANVAGGKAPALMTAKEIKVGIAIMPLLERRIEVHELVFDGAKIALEIDAKGAPNWIFGPPPAAGPAPSPGATPAPAPLPALTVHTVRAEGAQITYANAQTSKAYVIDAISADSALTGWDQPMTLNAAGVFNTEDVRLTATLARAGALLNASETGLRFIADSAPVKISFDGEAALSSGVLKGALEASGPSLRNASAWAGAPLGEGGTLQAFAIKGAVVRTDTEARFENAEISIDAIKGRGDLMLETASRKPTLSGRLELFGLDLNPYLMVAKPAAQTASVEIAAIDVDKAGWDESALDFSGLKAIDASIDLTISGPLKVQAMSIDALKASVLVLDGVFTATMSEMRLYGGLGAGRFRLDGREKTLVLENELAVQGVRAENFLEALIGFNALAAPAEVRFAISSVGGTQKALMQNLRGQGDFKFTQGALKGVDFGGASRTIGNLLDGKLIGPNAATPFNGFSASFRIEKGVAATRDFTLENREMRLTSIGSVDIGKQTLDLRLTSATIVGRGRDGQASTGVPLSFVMRGPWAKPAFAADLFGGARQAVERDVCRVLGQAPGARRAGC